MLDFLIKNWGLAILVWVLLAFCDYWLTILGASLYRKHAAATLVYEHGYELNPTFEKEVARLRWFSWKHALLIAYLAIALAIFPYLKAFGVFEFFYGAVFLVYVVIDLRHLQNIAFFHNLRRPGSANGNIQYSYWISQRNSANLFLSQALLFAIAGLAAGRLFFWGGAAYSLFLGLRSYALANRKFQQPAPAAEQKASDLES
jgi:hypothetical protein